MCYNYQIDKIHQFRNCLIIHKSISSLVEVLPGSCGLYNRQEVNSMKYEELTMEVIRFVDINGVATSDVTTESDPL